MKKLLLIAFLSINLLAINLHQLKENSKEGVMSFKQMEDFYKQSYKAEHKIALAVLYTFGSKEKDDLGYEVIPNYILAVKYYKEAYAKGQKDAMTIMYGYLIQEEKFRKAIDPTLKKTEKGLLKEVEKKNIASYSLLGNLYVQTNQGKKALKILHKGDMEMDDATSQFGLAMIYYKGLSSCTGDKVTQPGESATATYFLNKACHNPNKTEELEKVCTNPMFVQMEQENISLEP